jgi:hypothetical protein
MRSKMKLKKIAKLAGKAGFLFSSNSKTVDNIFWNLECSSYSDELAAFAQLVEQETIRKMRPVASETDEYSDEYPPESITLSPNVLAKASAIATAHNENVTITTSCASGIGPTVSVKLASLDHKFDITDIEGW